MLQPLKPLKRTVPYLAVACLALTVLFGASLVFAGGAACKEQHTQADYTKMAEKMATYGWLGVEKEKNAAGAGYVVKTVAAGSPAEAAGFRTGDVLVAMNGVRLAEENKDALYKVKATLGVGKPVTYTVARSGREQQLTATLAPVPREVMAQWLGEHVLDNHSTFMVAQAGN